MFIYGNNRMPMVSEVRSVIKRIAFGNTLLPQEFTLGLPVPTGGDHRVAAWGSGEPRDVTNRHSMVCAAPLTICIGFDEGQVPPEKDLAHLSLKFCERDGRKQVLAEIGLKPQTAVAEARSEFILFEPRSSKNFCLPRARLCAHYLLHAYLLFLPGSGGAITPRE